MVPDGIRKAGSMRTGNHAAREAGRAGRWPESSPSVCWFLGWIRFPGPGRRKGCQFCGAYGESVNRALNFDPQILEITYYRDAQKTVLRNPRIPA